MNASLFLAIFCFWFSAHASYRILFSDGTETTIKAHQKTSQLIVIGNASKDIDDIRWWYLGDQIVKSVQEMPAIRKEYFDFKAGINVEIKKLEVQKSGLQNQLKTPGLNEEQIKQINEIIVAINTRVEEQNSKIKEKLTACKNKIAAMISIHEKNKRHTESFIQTALSQDEVVLVEGVDNYHEPLQFINSVKLPDILMQPLRLTATCTEGKSTRSVYGNTKYILDDLCDFLTFEKYTLSEPTLNFERKYLLAETEINGKKQWKAAARYFSCSTVQSQPIYEYCFKGQARMLPLYWPGSADRLNGVTRIVEMKTFDLVYTVEELFPEGI